MQQEIGLSPRDTSLSQKAIPITIHPTFLGPLDPGPGNMSQEDSFVRDFSRVPFLSSTLVSHQENAGLDEKQASKDNVL